MGKPLLEMKGELVNSVVIDSGTCEGSVRASKGSDDGSHGVTSERRTIWVYLVYVHDESWLLATMSGRRSEWVVNDHVLPNL